MQFSTALDHPKTSIAGLLIAITIAAPIVSQVNWAHVSTVQVCGMVGALATALLGAFYAHDPDSSQDESGTADPAAGLPRPTPPAAATPGPTALKRLAVTVCILFLAVPLLAQSATSGGSVVPQGTSNAVVVSSDVVAVLAPDGSASTGSVNKEAFDLMEFGATKGNHLYLEGTEALMPVINTSFYGGGIALQPDIAKLFAKTNVASGNLNLVFDGGAGFLSATSANKTTSLIGGYGGAVLKYNFSSTLAWNSLRVEYVLAGGKLYQTYSTGITAFFGK